MAKFKAAIIGCGPHNAGRGGINSISYAHARAMAHLPEVELVAAVSRSAENVAAFCAEFASAVAYTDYREMLANEKPDWVSICAFPPDRETMARAALEAGCRILWIEKPFTVTLGAARRILAAAGDCRVYVNHQRRYGRCFEWFRQEVVGQRFGALRQINVRHPGTGFINFGPHLVDAALYALGDRPAMAVQAAIDWSTPGNYQGIRTETSILGNAWFFNDVRLLIESGEAFTPPALQAVCDCGIVEVYLGPCGSSPAICRASGAGIEEELPEFEEHFHHNDTNPNLFYDRAAADIWETFQTRQPSRIDAENALRGLEIMTGLYESAKSGRRLSLPLTDEASF